MYYGARAEKEEILSTMYSLLDVSRAMIAAARETETEAETERKREREREKDRGQKRRPASLEDQRKTNIVASIFLLFVQAIQSVFIELMN